MNTLAINVISKSRRPRTIRVEMNADRFERLAAQLGFFSDSFLHSVDLAERDYRAGRVRTVRSLRALRK